MTAALEAFLARTIAGDGPIGVDAFMALALGHPEHGYYMTRDPLGAAGDFTTAPEISQMFGELIGAWLADMWLRLGSPAPVLLVEAGPGRGTLMADALRATARVPGFHAALRLHLVETSPVLRERQARTLGAWTPVWLDRVEDLPHGPLLFVANEFFDALPIRQFVRGDGRWGERKVGLDADGRLGFVLDPRPGALLVPPGLRQVPPGSLVEICPAGAAVAAAVAGRIARFGGAALVIDYGYSGPAVGDTLQALRGHAPVPVLETPGEADLTAHVDFTALADAAQSAGAACHGPVEQGPFLMALGLAARAESLKRLASPDQAHDIDRAANRLAGDTEMGRLFKVMAMTRPDGPPPVGFAG